MSSVVLQREVAGTKDILVGVQCHAGALVGHGRLSDMICSYNAKPSTYFNTTFQFHLRWFLTRKVEGRAHCNTLLSKAAPEIAAQLTISKLACPSLQYLTPIPGTPPQVFSKSNNWLGVMASSNSETRNLPAEQAPDGDLAQVCNFHCLLTNLGYHESA
jgi:hypothetical protein